MIKIKITVRSLLICFILVIGVLPKVYSQPPNTELKVYTILQDDRVLLTWNSRDDITRYNLYRRTSSNPTYSVTPINSLPIEAITNCIDFKQIIPNNSLDWNIISSAFSDNITPFDPCQLHTIDVNHEKYGLLSNLANSRINIAKVVGLAFDDLNLNVGTTYYYRIVGVDNNGNETGTLDEDVSIVVGSPPMVPPPTNVRVQDGDARVIIYWDQVNEVSSFNIKRSDALSGTYELVNEFPNSSLFGFDFDNDELTPEEIFPGFLDYQRWDDITGEPIDHQVGSNNIFGPENGKHYHYIVQSVDFIGNKSSFSHPPIMASPKDLTPPRSPFDVVVTPDEPNSKFDIRWTNVTKDADGHIEVNGVSGYNIYRYENVDDPSIGGVQVGGLVVPQSQLPFLVYGEDNSTGLRSSYGEKTYYYRVEAIDYYGNRSARSAAIGGALKDIVPPLPPKNVIAEGDNEFIKVSWDLNSEPDMDEYDIYRSLCNLGEWVPCRETKYEKDSLPCSGPFMLVGSLSHKDAKDMITGSTLQPYYDDYTVPLGSPICYAYLIKARDKSQNINITWPIPQSPPEEIVCQRLRDKTPPAPAFISKLMARDNKIIIEWIGAPVQDIKAYHIYRATEENGNYKWVGGRSVILNGVGPLLTGPYEPISGFDVDCSDIPLNTFEEMSTGSIADNQVLAKEIYWYKVLGIDLSGNESSIKDAVPVSTFTYSTTSPLKPIISTIAESLDPCGLVINWTPVYDVSATKGFALYRKDKLNGQYHQIGSIILNNSYLDSTIVNNKTYWYQVMQLDINGTPSPLSKPKFGVYTP